MKQSILSIFLLAASMLMGEISLHLPPKVTLRIEQQNAFEGKPISMSIIVDHMQSDIVDIDSFQMNGEKCVVQPVGVRAVVASMDRSSSPIDTFVTSQYSAFLTPKSAGIHVIGPIDVKIGGSMFHSNSITINVLESVVTKDFTIESKIQAPKNVYPGQKFSVLYRIRFKNSIQMLKEELPLLDLEGFTPLGSPNVVDTDLGNGFFEETIEREFRARTPGTFQYAPSIIEGMYVVTSQGAQQLVPPLMTFKEAGKTIVVQPFPAEGRPAFFDGALGSFVWRGRILGSNRVNIDGYIEVEWRVSGRGDIDTVQFPVLENSTLFTSRFVIDGEPKEVRESDSSKKFIVLLRPKMAGIREVPGFQFASFEPSEKEYIRVVCPPLALEVTDLQPDQGQMKKNEPKGPRYLLPYDAVLLQGESSDVPLSLVSVLGFSTLFLVVGLFEKWYFGSKRQKGHVRKSRNIYYKAFSHRRQPKVSCKLLREALLLRLVEVGLLEDDRCSIESLSTNGVVGEARNILQRIDEYLFGKNGVEVSFDDLWKDFSLLYHTLSSLPEVVKK